MEKNKKLIYIFQQTNKRHMNCKSIFKICYENVEQFFLISNHDFSCISKEGKWWIYYRFWTYVKVVDLKKDKSDKRASDFIAVVVVVVVVVVVGSC